MKMKEERKGRQMDEEVMAIQEDQDGDINTIKAAGGRES
jgi:hypothetical protein